MITSGMSILRALYVLEWQTENKFLKETIVAVRKDVEAGLSLSDSLGRHPKVFNPLFVAMTQAGEAGGVLEDALLRVADQLEKDASLRRQIKSAMVYPALVVIFAVGVMMALVAFLVPVFEGVFKEFGGELPKITQVSVFLSHAVTGYWWLIFLLTGLAIFGFIKWKKSTWGRPQWDHFRLRIPMKIGAIVQEVAVARWARTLASLTSAGVPLLLALDITGRTGGNIAAGETTVRVGALEPAAFDADVGEAGGRAAGPGSAGIWMPLPSHAWTARSRASNVVRSRCPDARRGRLGEQQSGRPAPHTLRGRLGAGNGALQPVEVAPELGHRSRRRRRAWSA